MPELTDISYLQPEIGGSSALFWVVDIDVSIFYALHLLRFVPFDLAISLLSVGVGSHELRHVEPVSIHFTLRYGGQKLKEAIIPKTLKIRNSIGVTLV